MRDSGKIERLVVAHALSESYLQSTPEPVRPELSNVPPVGPARAEVALELEAKLTAPDAFSLPDLGVLGGGLAGEPRPTQDLDATYYDTADLRLARAGVTVRHRVGEGAARWTVKLPERAWTFALARSEVEFFAPATSVPPGVEDLVLSLTRGAPLGPVARLRTVRRPTVMRDSSGEVRLEIVDDAVQVEGQRVACPQFREVEVEVRQTDREGRRLLGATVDRLLAAGCVAGLATPKLVRALGPLAAAPPDVVVEVPAPEWTVADLVRQALARSVAQIVRHDPWVRLGDNDEDVHELRVATRRLRLNLRTFASVLDVERTTPLRAELAWLGAQVGALRDLDVLAARFGDLPVSAVDADGRAALLARLTWQRAGARVPLIETMRTPRYLALLDRLVEVTHTPPLASGARDQWSAPANAAASFVARPWRQLEHAVDRLADDAPSAELHRVRILAKRCRYAAEAVAPAVPRAADLADAVAALQRVLGEHQDTVVAEEWLRRAAAEEPGLAVVAGQLIARELDRRASARRRWRTAWRAASAKRLRRWL